MTDDDIDELLHPPRRWPPFTVVAAATLLLLPPVGLAVTMLGRGGPVELLVPLVWLLIAGGPVYRLLRGYPAGYGGAVGVLLLVAVVTLVPAVVALANGGDLYRGMLVILPTAGWLVCVAACLWWPATRIWCGRLAPDPYAEADD